MVNPKKKHPSDSNQLAASVLADVIKVSDEKPRKVVKRARLLKRRK